MVLADRKREIKTAHRLSVAETNRERQALKRAVEDAREADRVFRAARKADAESARIAARLAREQARAMRAQLKAQLTHRRRNAFQPYMFHIGRVPSPSKIFKYALSLDAPLSSDRRFGVGSIADTVVDPTPNILERMVAAEGVQRVIQRLSEEKQIPITQARAIVEALVDSDLLEDGSLCDLAEMLRSGWQANRLLAHATPRPLTLAQKPSAPNPDPYQYEHWRQRYGLSKSGRVITRHKEVENFGGAWSVETALPEEIEKVA